MFCKNCGSEIKEGNNFCTNCGKSVKNVQRKVNRKFNCILILIAIIIILISILALYKINQKSKNISENSKINNSTKQITELKIDNLTFDVKIDSNTDMQVTETWNISSVENYGFYKTFVLDDKYGGISNVKVCEILNSGEKKEFIETLEGDENPKEGYYYGLVNKDSDFEISWSTNMKNETKTFQISYTVKEAVNVYNDCAELYWAYIGNKFSIPIKNIKGNIYIEGLEDINEVKMWGHSKLNGNLSTNNNSIIFSAENFTKGDYAEIRLLLPKESFITYNIKDKEMTEKILTEENNIN